MAKKRLLDVVFPPGGMDRKSAYKQSQPYTTFDCMNVWPTGQLEQRSRGGSRSGLVQVFDAQLGSPVRMLTQMVVASTGTDAAFWADDFSSASLAPWWGANVPQGYPLPIVMKTGYVGTGEGAEELDSRAHAYRTSLAIDVTGSYTLSMYIAPYQGTLSGGTYSFHARLDDAAPDNTEDGVHVQVVTNWSGSGTFKISWGSRVGGAYEGTGEGSNEALDISAGGWFRATFSGNNIISGSYQGITEAINMAHANHSGAKIGFSIGSQHPTHTPLWISLFNATYTSLSTPGALDGAGLLVRTVLTASANGELWAEATYGELTQVTTDLTLRDDCALTSAQNGQKLYIADYGDLRAAADDGVVSGATLDSATYTDWTTLGILTDDDVCVISGTSGSEGTYEISSVASGAVTLTSSPGDNTGLSFRIERGPKVYSPIDGTLSLLVATVGQVPTGNPLIARHLGRIVFAGAETAPHVWYASRQSDELDWDYAELDDQRAVAGTSSDMGLPGQAVTALISHSDDYLVFGCRDQVWRMRGDPALSGGLDALSYTIGIVDKDAWCLGPGGELIFLSLDGLYGLASSGESKPVSISRELIPDELRYIDVSVINVSLEYSTEHRGVFIFLTDEASGGQTHWWFDWGSKTFWPLSYSSSHEPTATCNSQSNIPGHSGIIIGGVDGTLRKHARGAEDDDGTNFSSYIDIGPIPLAPSGQVGRLLSMEGVVAENSGDITWGVYPALTFEAAASATTASETGTWVAGLNMVVRSVGRGQAIMLRLTGTAGSRWAFEGVAVEAMSAGRRRTP